MTPRRALELLIAGSGLTIARYDAHLVSLQAVPEQSSSQLEELIVTA